MGGVVAYDVDRLSRNQNQIEVLFDEAEQAGTQLQFGMEKFEDTATGRFILAARAFIGEVEREKISERTMRGKAERARTGKIPQGTGIGCYGYTYDRETGTRAVASQKAKVIRGDIFRLPVRCAHCLHNEPPERCRGTYFQRVEMVSRDYTRRTTKRNLHRADGLSKDFGLDGSRPKNRTQEATGHETRHLRMD